MTVKVMFGVVPPPEDPTKPGWVRHCHECGGLMSDRLTGEDLVCEDRACRAGWTATFETFRDEVAAGRIWRAVSGVDKERCEWCGQQLSRRGAAGA